MGEEEKVACRTPAEGRDGVTNIPRWKYDAVRQAILATINGTGSDGFPFKDLAAAVGTRLSEDERGRLGSLGWHTTVVKLNMEVDGEIARMAKATPQRLVLL